MNRDLYSNHDFQDLRNRINKEMLRRGSYTWWGPLTRPSVGVNHNLAKSIPNGEMKVDEKTYTVNNPSEGSIEPTRNRMLDKMGSNPSGNDYEFSSSSPDTSAAHFTAEEMRNMIVGLSSIRDIKYHYGRNEKPNTVYRDPQPILDSLEGAENDKLHWKKKFDLYFRINEQDEIELVYNDEVIERAWIEEDEVHVLYRASLTDEEEQFFSELNIRIEDGELIIEHPTSTELYLVEIVGDEVILGSSHDMDKLHNVRFSINDDGEIEVEQSPHHEEITTEIKDDRLLMKFGEWNFNNRREDPPHYELDGDTLVMPSGERDGEECVDWKGPSRTNFFDDYGASPGDGNYHPYNRGFTPKTRRDLYVQDDRRVVNREVVKEGGVRTSDYGPNPRNPNSGKPYKGRPVYEGVPGSCQGACTGLCYVTCDDMCSESCRTTCWASCGNACTSSCGNVCTGCSTLCLSSCRTKCSNSVGHACVRAGAKTLRITTTGGVNPRNSYRVSTYSCEGCQFSCQFYPNKKTECWDAGCMGKCFTSCMNACLDSCTGGCINNASEGGSDYKNGKGRGCSSGCTMNCIGDCRGVCEGSCVHTCFSGCKQLCSDNCEWTCSTICSSDCENGCSKACTALCGGSCSSECIGVSTSNTCSGCSSAGGCTATCQHECSNNCINSACRSLCGTDAAGTCSFNCRINCSSTSCTALCSDACSSLCTTCVNNAGWGCSVCTSLCSTGCESACNVTCTLVCEHSCETNCVQSCHDECSDCAGLCYSCVSMCIGVCSLKCENGCSHGCDVSCEQWCDQSCSQECFASCDIYCVRSCSGSCITFLTSQPDQGSDLHLNPEERENQYPDPTNREEEQEAFNIIKE